MCDLIAVIIIASFQLVIDIRPLCLHHSLFSAAQLCAI